MTDTGWTFEGRRVIESEYAPDPGRIKHLGAASSGGSPFLSRIINTCDLHGAILDVSDPVQNVRAAYDYHTQRNVNASKERTMATDHIDQLAQWYADAEQVTKDNLPNKGDTLIYPNSGSDGYIIEPNPDEWTPNIVGHHETARILARAPKPKPAWHDALAVIATWDSGGDEAYAGLWTYNGAGMWVNARGAEVHRDYLTDVTPLIEAKVTDEMVHRAAVAFTRARDDGHVKPFTAALTAALGLETV